jgi:hypothetical protein
MKLYRVENPTSQDGLWYRGNNAQPSNVVHQLELSGRVLPMDFDQSIAQGDWRSAAESIELLKFWFTLEDLAKLQPLGYGLYEISPENVRVHSTEMYTHHLYQHDGTIYRKLDIGILSPDYKV